MELCASEGECSHVLVALLHSCHSELHRGSSHYVAASEFNASDAHAFLWTSNLDANFYFCVTLREVLEALQLDLAISKSWVLLTSILNQGIQAGLVYSSFTYSLSCECCHCCIPRNTMFIDTDSSSNLTGVSGQYSLCR